MTKGRLFIIPIPISEESIDHVLPVYNHQLVKDLRCFVVEKLKTARQFLRKMDRTFPIDDSQFYELNKHDSYEFQIDALKQLESGVDVGLMSEAGYPGIADPGGNFIAKAHEKNITVVPLVGPSSIFLALAGSGMNGQGFTFHGYLPKKDPERTNELRRINQIALKSGYAQIFIETPYRNEVIFQDFLKCIDGELCLTIAYGLTSKEQKIKTATLNTWKKRGFSFGKVPCVFIVGKTE